jgi:BirA family biotin operon repressor/biotin-[acetyl-CoA-carboxylase] ligase
MESFEDQLREALGRFPESALGVIGRWIEIHRSLPSTNDRARALATRGAGEGTVVIAEEQTRGRGRSERTWHSAAGLGLYMSIILRPVAPGSEAPIFGLLAAVAAARAIDARIDWPNDLLVQGRKVAGILTEARSAQEAIRDLVIGIGVNVNHEAGDFPRDIRDAAISLRMATGRRAERVHVAASILVELGGWYTLWSREGRQPVLDAFSSMAVDLVGRRVRVLDDGEGWIGVTDGISRDGALRVRPERDGRHEHHAARAPGGAVEIRYGEVRVVEA